MKVLLIEDEPKIANFICAGLTERGFSVHNCTDGQLGFDMASQEQEDAWGYDFDPCTNVVDVYINRLRSKISVIDTSGKMAKMIKSERGTGYRLELEVS